MAELLPVLADACTVSSRPHLSTLTPFGQRDRATRNHEQTSEFCQFLAHEWGEAVSILIQFPPEENRGGGPERLMVNGRQLVWRMRYRNTHGAEETFLRVRPS